MIETVTHVTFSASGLDTLLHSSEPLTQGRTKILNPRRPAVDGVEFTGSDLAR